MAKKVIKLKDVKMPLNLDIKFKGEKSEDEALAELKKLLDEAEAETESD